MSPDTSLAGRYQPGAGGTTGTVTNGSPADGGTAFLVVLLATSFGSVTRAADQSWPMGQRTV
ncbi:hypothetical protein [Streptomyces sp. NPDC001450]